jgi:hypothetical protein
MGPLPKKNRINKANPTFEKYGILSCWCFYCRMSNLKLKPSQSQSILLPQLLNTITITITIKGFILVSITKEYQMI